MADDRRVGRKPFLHEEDRLRAHVYGWLARFLAHPPVRSDLELAARFRGDTTDLGLGFAALSAIASAEDIGAVDQEYHDLFIGDGHGELHPYASHYLAASADETPLELLRGAMRELGIERAPSVKEREDHIAALMDTMAGLIRGASGTPADLAVQHRFFAGHIGNWAPRFFQDLEAAKASAFYQPVGTIGRVFMHIETAAFDMD